MIIKSGHDADEPLLLVDRAAAAVDRPQLGPPLREAVGVRVIGEARHGGEESHPGPVNPVDDVRRACVRLGDDRVDAHITESREDRCRVVAGPVRPIVLEEERADHPQPFRPVMARLRMNSRCRHKKATNNGSESTSVTA